MKKQFNALIKFIATLSGSIYLSYGYTAAMISIPELKHSVSLPLDALVEQYQFNQHMQHKNYYVPFNRAPLKLPKNLTTVDEAIQSFSGLPLSTINGLNLMGLGVDYPNFFIIADPPDTNASVGDTQVVQWVNSSFVIFDKSTGQVVSPPMDGNVLWQGFGGPCENQNSGDPIVKYDQLAHRWIFTQFAVDNIPFTQCIAISQTSDARGPYYLYSYDFGTNFNDYAKLGVWPDAYYMSFDMFPIFKPDDLKMESKPTGSGPAACALDRSNMLKGAPTKPIQCFQPQPPTGFFLPSDLDGKTLPPKGLPNYFVGTLKDAKGTMQTNQIGVWKFHVDWDAPLKSKFIGPIRLNVASFNPLICNDPDTICIPQKGTSFKLDAISDRVMYRLAYRNFGRYQSMVVNHTVKVGPSKSGIRWYEIRINNVGTPGIYQQGTYTQNDENSRWMGSIAMDKAGNMALGYSVSGAIYPSIRYTGRHPTDVLNTMRSEKTISNGSGYQTSSDPRNRWGDYSSMAIDPSDDCTFWYTTEYMKTIGEFSWSTRLASFRFPNCR